MTKAALFDYELPGELVAPVPAQRRDESRLLALEQRSGAVTHLRFEELPRLLRAGDLLVVNDARVLTARLAARRSTGGKVDVLLVRQAAIGPEGPRPCIGGDAVWLAMLRPSGRLKEGEVLHLERPGADVQLLQERGSGFWTVRFGDSAPPVGEILREGSMPLPPYILKARRRRGIPEQMPELDRTRYQTVFAKEPGAVAAPTAGLHFTKDVLDRLQDSGVLVRSLTLLVGPGTFRPVRTEQIEEHHLEPEFYHLPGETARAVASARREGRRVIATGTTCCRVLEYVARHGIWQEHSGWTDLFIYPPFEFKVVGALLTNFHLPRSTLLMLVCAFAGRERILSAYAEAIKEGYRFYSYGDAMLIY